MIVSALPLTDETVKLFNSARFAKCRPGTLFVNIGRGKTVDMPALQDARQSGTIAAAGLDVTDPEPLPPGHPVWTIPNLIVTPHIAGGGGYARLADFVGENVERFCSGEQPLSVIQR